MKALITDNVDGSAVDVLEAAGMEVQVMPTMPEEELCSVIKGYDALVVRSATKVTRRVMEAGDNLRVIGRAGAGVDNIDLEAAKDHGIEVFNAPSGNINAVAEHTMALMLSLARGVHRAHAHVSSGGWEKKLFKGIELRGKTLGVIGLGKIGRLVSAAASGMGMEVIAYDPYVSAEQAGEMGIRWADMAGVFSSSDFITVHVPLTDGTRNLIGEKEMSSMKDSVRILNVARGGIIDEAALYDAIKSGKVAGAALDVWESEPPEKSPLLSLDEVLATPHLGGNTKEAQKNVALDVAEKIAEFFKGS